MEFEMPNQSSIIPADFSSALDTWTGMLSAWQRVIQSTPGLAPKVLDQSNVSSWVSGGQFSLLSTTVNQQKTNAPELEEQIVTKVASYGKQLGRLMEAVDVLAKHLRPQVADENRKALDALTELAAEISDERKQFEVNRLDGILKSVKELGRPEHVDHAALGKIRDLVDELDR
jgi:hypothetical protein